MELEFDKEIDAILRKARPNKGVLVGDEPPDKPEPKKHLDADAIAAFAENALPDKAKLLYIEHFADCDRCRKQLSFLMQMNTGETALSVPAPVDAVSIPWYQSFFKAPNLALAMGALILMFSGVLGYLVFQNQKAADSATVSQVKEQEQPRGVPNLGSQSGMANAAPANIMPATNAAAAANVSAETRRVMDDTSSGPSERSDADQGKSDAMREDSSQIGGVAAGAPFPADKSAAKIAAAPPVTTDVTSSSEVAAEGDEKRAGDDRQVKEESKDNLAIAKQKRAENERGYRDAPPPAAKAGPSRSGPSKNQANQMNSQMPVTRVVGGKTFNNRDGAWYDSAYQNQATANYRRSSVEYKKLDSGLRNIADTLGGKVVIVWKSRAYRIQ